MYGLIGKMIAKAGQRDMLVERGAIARARPLFIIASVSAVAPE